LESQRISLLFLFPIGLFQWSKTFSNRTAPSPRQIQ